MLAQLVELHQRGVGVNDPLQLHSGMLAQEMLRDRGQYTGQDDFGAADGEFARGGVGEDSMRLNPWRISSKT